MCTKKMKILILGFTKIKYMPYLNFYLDNIDKKSNEVHLLYWNRDTKEETLPQEIICHEFRRYQEDDKKKIKKLSAFFAYRRFALSCIRKIQPDRIIFMHTLPGVLLSKKLVKKFKGKFIYVYRDITYEYFSPFRKIVHKLVKASFATFVSSDAFRIYLPKSEEDKIHTTHNILMESLAHREEKESSGICSEKIRIAFWGFIRHEEINREIINKISRDERFELHYYGREQEIAINLKKYADDIRAKNVFFHGEYKPEDRYVFVRETDIIHNIYCDENMMLAMPNKYYDGLIFYLPQLCLEGSFMGNQAEKNKVGYTCDPKAEDFTQRIYEYYQALSKKDFKVACDEELDRVMWEYEQACTFLKNFLSNENLCEVL